jgi:hypothetical protein
MGREDVKSAMGAYCRQYKCSACIFFSLIAHLSIEDLSAGAQTHFGFYYAHNCFVVVRSLSLLRSMHKNHPLLHLMIYI